MALNETFPPDPGTPAERLQRAKDDFRMIMLADDTVFDLLRISVVEAGEDPDSLVAFTMEPTIKRLPERKSVIGVLIKRAGLAETGLDEVSVGVARLSDITLGVLERESNVFRPTEEVVEALARSGRPAADSLDIFRAWQEGLQGIAQSYDGPPLMNPITHTFEAPTS